ncbi:MAG: PLP-dependent aspartate aminotransferase family protein [Desulfovibrio sp.]|jgi:cystathionine beta-lyase|nr:PLP-dependent aspartate aminotransferase family protein [Desulfovibrio sp.]
MQFKSRIIHAGQDRDPYTGASGVPVYLASTFDQRSAARGGFDYTRSGNPTREALEQSMADLENGALALAFASGMAAVSSTLLLFSPGDHLVVSEDVYGGTYRVLTRLFSRLGLESTFVDSADRQAVRQALRPETKGIFVESPSNPLLKITDLPFIAELAREHGILGIVDNTFCTPFLQRPLELGFDIVVHSATKFLNGHSDVLAGVVIARERKTGERLRFIQNAFGAVLGVQDCWLLLRGLKTLAVRMEASQAGARRLAPRLAALPEVRRVFYPGLEGHPGADIHNAQAGGPGAVLSFELESPALTKIFLQSVALPLVSVSLGGVESILSHPATMSHASMPAEEREKRGISDALVRLSVGLEDPEDIWRDLRQALGTRF